VLKKIKIAATYFDNVAELKGIAGWTVYRGTSSKHYIGDGFIVVWEVL
jgi:hypothetical protein